VPRVEIQQLDVMPWIDADDALDHGDIWVIAEPDFGFPLESLRRHGLRDPLR
jgi:hypothetical protein